MGTRVVQDGVIDWREEVTDDITKEKRLIQHLAFAGQEVDLPAGEEERLELVGAERRSNPLSPVKHSPLLPKGQVATLEAAGDELHVTQLAAWISEEKPKVQEVIDAANGDPGEAQKLIDAENTATGQKPRKSVIEGLQEVIDAS